MEPPVILIDLFDTQEQAKDYSKKKNDELRREFYETKSEITPKEIAAYFIW